VAAVLPGYASVARAAEALHLAPRSVRDLIYAGRLPSLRIGRLHYVRATDLEQERRRRLGLRLPAQRRPARRRPAPVGTPRPERSAIGGEVQRRPERPRVDPALRRQRAAERADVVRRWAQRHQPGVPRLPFVPLRLAEPTVCAACGRALRANQGALEARESAERLCLTCGRRALMIWSDQRRLEAAAARRLAQDLGTTLSPNLAAAPRPSDIGAAAPPTDQSPRAA
jgi:hypothetical protein